MISDQYLLFLQFLPMSIDTDGFLASIAFPQRDTSQCSGGSPESYESDLF
jgi:hypothetical protein